MALITTKFGDKGQTKLLNEVVSKADPIIHLLGEVDELSCILGLSGDKFDDIQTYLSEVMGYLYLKSSNNEKLLQKTNELENYIMSHNSSIPNKFINPKGFVSMARAICRRIERTIVSLDRQDYMDLTFVLKYFNRLSDFLFIQTFAAQNENEKEKELPDNFTDSYSNKIDNELVKKVA